MSKPRHECPDDPDEFFRVLYWSFQYRDKWNPDGHPECMVCGAVLVPASPSTKETKDGQ